MFLKAASSAPCASRWPLGRNPSSCSCRCSMCRPSRLCTTLVRSRQSMQLTRKTPVCGRRTCNESRIKTLAAISLMNANREEPVLCWTATNSRSGRVRGAHDPTEANDMGRWFKRRRISKSCFSLYLPFLLLLLLLLPFLLRFSLWGVGWSAMVLAHFGSRNRCFTSIFLLCLCAQLTRRTLRRSQLSLRHSL